MDFKDSQNDTSDQEDKIRVFSCFKMEQAEDPSEGEELIECNIGGVTIRMLIDSWSSVNVLNGDDWKKLEEQKATVWNTDPERTKKLKPYAVTVFFSTIFFR